MHIDRGHGRLWVEWYSRRLRLGCVMWMLGQLRMLHRVTRVWWIRMIHLHVRRLRWQSHAMRRHGAGERLVGERVVRMHETVRADGIRHANF